MPHVVRRVCFTRWILVDEWIDKGARVAINGEARRVTRAEKRGSRIGIELDMDLSSDPAPGDEIHVGDKVIEAMLEAMPPFDWTLDDEPV